MKIVVALGGNALGNTLSEQKELVKIAASNIVDLIKQNHEVIITHGNGPQVGMINLAMDYASKNDVIKEAMPFAECGAMSQAYIGYHLEQALLNELKKQNIKKDVTAVITRVLVDENDKAFQNPTKPIGSFYTKEEAKKLEEKGQIMKEDANRGYRRVVPSPKPIKIIEANSIKTLIENGIITIATGGGGIPVILKNNEVIGIDAVIDKDFSSAKLAEEINADLLLILTTVNKVCINYGKENQKELNELNIEQAKELINNNEFAKGSMLPKIEACMQFVKNTKKQAIITSLLSTKKALKGEDGTLIKLS